MDHRRGASRPHKRHVPPSSPSAKTLEFAAFEGLGPLQKPGGPGWPTGWAPGRGPRGDRGGSGEGSGGPRAELRRQRHDGTGLVPSSISPSDAPISASPSSTWVCHCYAPVPLCVRSLFALPSTPLAHAIPMKEPKRARGSSTDIYIYRYRPSSMDRRFGGVFFFLMQRRLMWESKHESMSPPTATQCENQKRGERVIVTARKPSHNEDGR